MSMPIEIEDGEGTLTTAGVNSRRALKVSLTPTPPGDVSNDILTARKLFKGFLTEPGGSADMNVDGSSATVVFNLDAEVDRVIWVTAARLILNGANLEMNTNDFRRFGSATAANTALANGVQMFVKQSGVNTEIFAEAVVRIGDFYNYSDDDKNIINAISAQSDFLSFDFDFDAPVALPSGSADQICIKIRDDLTAIDYFRCIVRGYQETL